MTSSLHNCYGYSPNQLVFGQNPSLSSFVVNDLPAIEEGANDLLRKHLNAMSESHKVFIECEANEHLCPAVQGFNLLTV